MPLSRFFTLFCHFFALARSIFQNFALKTEDFFYLFILAQVENFRNSGIHVARQKTFWEKPIALGPEKLDGFGILISLIFE